MDDAACRAWMDARLLYYVAHAADGNGHVHDSKDDVTLLLLLLPFGKKQMRRMIFPNSSFFFGSLMNS